MRICMYIYIYVSGCRPEMSSSCERICHVGYVVIVTLWWGAGGEGKKGGVLYERTRACLCEPVHGGSKGQAG